MIVVMHPKVASRIVEKGGKIPSYVKVLPAKGSNPFVSKKAVERAKKLDW